MKFLLGNNSVPLPPIYWDATPFSRPNGGDTPLNYGYPCTILGSTEARPGGLVTSKEVQEQWEIVFVIDRRESDGMKERLHDRFRSTNAEQLGLQPQQQQPSLPIVVEERQIPLGDYLWLLRKRREFCTYQHFLQLEKEYILDWIVERKTIQDLVHSLEDMRLDSQYQKLSRCGLNVVFLLEQSVAQHHYLQQQQMISPESRHQIDRIVDFFLMEIIRTEENKIFLEHKMSQHESVEYLWQMTSRLGQLHARLGLQRHQHMLFQQLGNDHPQAPLAIHASTLFPTTTTAQATSTAATTTTTTFVNINF